MKLKHLSTEMSFAQFTRFIETMANLEDEAVLYTSKSGQTLYCDGNALFTNARGRTRVCGDPSFDRSYIDHLINFYSTMIDYEPETLQYLVDTLRSFK